LQYDTTRSEAASFLHEPGTIPQRTELMKRILVIGSTGQIGSELTLALRDRYGADNVIAGVHSRKLSTQLLETGPYRKVDCTDIISIAEVVKKFSVNVIYHLAAMLSVTAETNPQMAWHVNMNGLRNVLDIAREYGCAVFVPSSIGVFGPTTPRENTPQDTIQRPTTIYGITKLAGELLCDYYYNRYGVDCRGVRYPGIISYRQLPGGGTTDYAVEIFYAAIEKRRYTCFLRPDTRLDMMYMPDTIHVAILIMEADPVKIVHRNAYNITAMSIAPEDFAREIKKHIPDFCIDYEIDPVRQTIADSWPNKMDDRAAREEFGWKPEYDLASMTSDMLDKLSVKLKKKLK
jgi:nucleoside-diphosphate-sugar epimerase